MTTKQNEIGSRRFENQLFNDCAFSILNKSTLQGLYTIYMFAYLDVDQLFMLSHFV